MGLMARSAGLPKAGIGRTAVHLQRSGGGLGVLFTSLRGAADPERLQSHRRKRPLEVASTLRAGPWTKNLVGRRAAHAARFPLRAILGFAWPPSASSAWCSIGGSTSGENTGSSQCRSTIIEALAYTQAHWLAGGMVLFSFAVLLTLLTLNLAGGRAHERHRQPHPRIIPDRLR